MSAFERYARLPRVLSPSIVINDDMLHSVLTKEECASYKQVLEHFVDSRTKQECVVIFYPGSREDVLFPLLFCNVLFDTMRIELYMIDPELDEQVVHERVRLLTGISLDDWESESLSVYPVAADVFVDTDDVLPEHIDLYFERAFSPWRTEALISSVKNNMSPSSLLVSDNAELGNKIYEQKNIGFYGQTYICRRD